jgi:DNA-binding MarR family transcriptional regulator
MENIVLGRRNEESSEHEAWRLPVMRTLARLHECDVETLLSKVDASEPEVHSVLREMVSKDEVEPTRDPSGGREERFTLTAKGWGEYLRALSSIYELSE